MGTTVPGSLVPIVPASIGASDRKFLASSHVTTEPCCIHHERFDRFFPAQHQTEHGARSLMFKRSAHRGPKLSLLCFPRDHGTVYIPAVSNINAYTQNSSNSTIHNTIFNRTTHKKATKTDQIEHGIVTNGHAGS